VRIFRFDKDVGKVLEQYGASGVTTVPIAKGQQTYRVTTAFFEPGGTIGQHLTGMPQIFMVLDGRGWVSGKSGGRMPISAGQAVMWESEEPHESGTEDGMTVVMLQATDPQVQMKEPPG
jgi:quercetin dioxygenase-like cupin family protein